MATKAYAEKFIKDFLSTFQPTDQQIYNAEYAEKWNREFAKDWG